MEHTPILHIMSIDDASSVCKITTVSLIKKNAAGNIALSLESMGKIIRIVFALHNRIVQYFWDTDPCYNIRINLFLYSFTTLCILFISENSSNALLMNWNIQTESSFANIKRGRNIIQTVSLPRNEKCHCPD